MGFNLNFGFLGVVLNYTYFEPEKEAWKNLSPKNPDHYCFDHF